MDIWKQLEAGVEADSLEATGALAAALAAALPKDCTLALFGDLGAGKTTFVRGLARAWGIDGHITSPSFAVYNLYRGAQRMLCHLDAYRLDGPAQFEALLLDEFLESPYCLAVEWPENVLEALPQDAILLDVKIARGNVRSFQLRR